MKNVLHIISSYDVFGPEKTTINECVALKNEGWNPAIINLDWHSNPPFNQKATRAGVKCNSLPPGKGISFRPLLALRKYLKEIDKDSVVHSHGYKADVMTLIASIGLKHSIVTSIHGFTTENSKVKVYEWLQVQSWRFYDRVFCVSNSYRNVAKAKGISEKKLFLLYNGIIMSKDPIPCANSDLRSKISTDDEVVVSIIGRLSPEKGHDSFIEIAKRVLATGRKAKFLIVGEGNERAAIEKLLIKSNLTNKVVLLGHVDDTQPVYYATDIVAICSTREGMPNVMLEAMLNSRPVVSFSVGGVHEVAGNEEGCLLVDPGDIEVFTTKLCGLIDSTERRDALGKMGAERIRNNFSFESRVAKIIKHYQELLNVEVTP